MRVDIQAYDNGIELPPTNQPTMNTLRVAPTVEISQADHTVEVSEGDTVNIQTVIANEPAMDISVMVAQGLQGPTGKRGKPGLSFYEEAVAKGIYSGTYEDFIQKFIPSLVTNKLKAELPMEWSSNNW